MKRILIAVLAVAFFSCSREVVETPSLAGGTAPENGTGVLTLTFGGGMTKTGSVPVHPDWESAVNKWDVLLFDAEGLIYRHRAFVGAGLGSVTVKNVKTGYYRIAVLANAPESMILKSVTDVDGLYGKALSLADNTRDTGLVMLTPRGFADRTWNVACERTTSVEAVLERPLSRVSLSLITNCAPVPVTIESIMLTNVADSIRADGTVLSWINRQGRVDETSRVKDHIIGMGSYRASCEGLTYCRIGKDIPGRDTCCTAYCLYGNANSSTLEPAGFTPAFPSSGEKTCLVVTAVMDGKRCYYPLVLDSMRAGESYDCTLRIIGRGSDDPNLPVKSGKSAFTVTMKSWGSSYTYDDNI